MPSPTLDNLDLELIELLRRDGRASLATLAGQLKITRATVRARMERLQASGKILNFTVKLDSDLGRPQVSGITLVKILGHKTGRILQQLRYIPEVQDIYSTNGKWDLLVEIAAPNLERFDRALDAMRAIDGIAESETNLRLAAKR